jgi:hypothetical protein
MAMAKYRAEQKAIPFNISHEYLIGLWEGSEGKCKISNRSFDLTPTAKFGQVNMNAPSIDRIIPKLGYVQGNVRLVTYHVNVALSEFGIESLKVLCNDIIKFA